MGTARAPQDPRASGCAALTPPSLAQDMAKLELIDPELYKHKALCPLGRTFPRWYMCFYKLRARKLRSSGSNFLGGLNGEGFHPLKDNIQMESNP